MKSFKCRRALLLSSALIGVTYFGGRNIAVAQSEPTYQLNIPAESLSRALKDFSVMSSQQLVFSERDVSNHGTPALHGSYTRDQALAILLSGTDLHIETSPSGVLMVKPKNVQAASNEGAANLGAKIETVVVTGTHILGQVETSSPIQTINRVEINRSGVASLPDLLSTVSSNAGGGIGVETAKAGVTTQNAYNNRGFSSGADLRGLGSDATLVLLNGHRLPIASSGYSVDLSVIPLASIDHVDILKDGASSIYGSDAVAGVVNVVTRKDFDGSETRVTGGLVTDGVKRDYQLSELAGHSWSGGNAMVDYTYDNEGGLPVQDRSFASNSLAGNYLIPSSRSQSIFGTATQGIGSALYLSMDVLYNDRTTNAQAAFLHSGAAFLQTGHAADDTFIVAPHLRYDLAGDWDITLSGLYSASHTTEDTSSILTSHYVQNYKGHNSSIGLDVSGPILDLPGGPLNVAVGGEYRHEDYTATGSTDVFKRNRAIYSAYGEAIIPIIGESDRINGIELLQLDASVRYENYSDFGTTTNPKVGLLWHPTDGWSLRSTYSTSFRAPEFAELGSINTNLLATLPDPLSPTGTSLTLWRLGGNTGLQPETARNWTSGITWNTSDRNFIVDVGYYDIHFNGIIEAPNQGFQIQTQPAIYAPFLIRNPSSSLTGPIVAGPTFLNFYGPFTLSQIQLLSDSRLQNLATLDTSGVDVDVNVAHEFDLGTVSGTLDFTYVTDYRQSIAPGQPAVSLLNTTYYPVDLKLRARVGWSQGPWSANGYLNFVDSYKNTAIASQVSPISSWTTFDLQLDYKSEDDTGPLSGTDVALSVRNLFNTAPPFVQNPSSATTFSSQVNYDPANASPLGRYISLRLIKQI